MRSILLTLALAASALGQVANCNTATFPVCTMGSPAGKVQIQPQAVPTSTTAVALSDAYLSTITIVNTTAGSLTFTLADRQASPIPVLKTVSIAPNTTYVISFPAGYWCPGGFTVLASGSGLTFYGSWAQ